MARPPLGTRRRRRGTRSERGFAGVRQPVVKGQPAPLAARSTTSVSLRRPTTATVSPRSAPLSQCAAQISPETRTWPSGRHGDTTVPTSPINVWAPTTERSVRGHGVARRAPRRRSTRGRSRSRRDSTVPATRAAGRAREAGTPDKRSPSAHEGDGPVAMCASKLVNLVRLRRIRFSSVTREARPEPDSLSESDSRVPREAAGRSKLVHHPRRLRRIRFGGAAGRRS